MASDKTFSFLFSQKSSKDIITRAGLPTATLFAGIDLLTTEPAPIIVLSPITTFLRSIELIPTKTLLPILTCPPQLGKLHHVICEVWTSYNHEPLLNILHLG